VERLSTGIGDLDLVLGGGMPFGSLFIVAGAPGTGKTILAQQLCFANATYERKALCYTTFSEPHAKLVRHLESFDFFDAEALERAVEVIHVGDLLGERGLTGFVEELTRKAFEVKPCVIVVDSSKVLHEFTEPGEFRRAIYELASKVAHSKAVLLFVGEYAEEEIENASEFAVADGILYLENRSAGYVDRRSLRVVKLRGSDYLSGLHTFRIGATGVEVFPRLEAVPPIEGPPREGRISIGVPALDEVMGGGITHGSTTLIAGPAGAGKTLLALRFIAEGIAQGERCHHLSFKETQPELAAKGRAFGLELDDAVASGLLTVRQVRPVEFDLDVVASELRAAVLDGPRARVVVDSLGALWHAARGEDRFRDYLWALIGLFQDVGAASVLTTETAAFFGPAFEFASGFTFGVDNLVMLRYLEFEDTVSRALNIVTMRDSDHLKDLVRFEIDPAAGGFRVLEDTVAP
jgi:circadian clock protein KaiC